MENLFDLLKSQVSPEMIGALTQQLGGSTKPEQTSTAVSSGMAILMNALSKNASNSQGASALGAALDKDHDGGILEDLMGYITGASAVTNTRAANGAGILGHLLGDKQGGAIDALSKLSGLDQNQSSSMLIKLAPIVLGMLGKQKKTSGISNSGLSDILAGAVSSANQNTPNPSLITSFLDQDGDGNLKNEAVSFGMKLLKGFFKK
jgi:hypothetical protein